MPWYQKSVHSIAAEFGVEPSVGLTTDQAQKNLEKFGANVLASGKSETLLDIFLRQFKSPLIYILLLAAFLIFALGQRVDSVVVLAVVIVNAFIGTFQEGRARNSLEKLKDLTKRKTLVRRDGKETIILSEEVVPGDILIIREGDSISADGRLITATSLTVDESALTGEAYSVAKNQVNITASGLGVGDQRNMVFSGTSVSSGYGEAIVIATGLKSELGKISEELAENVDVPFPLSQKVDKLTRFIGVGVGMIATVVFLMGVMRGIEIKEIFAAVVGLSVSIIPEGLPVVVTIVLAGGIWRMARAKAIVRQMAAVEAMGNADYLLVDKTGTITTGEMVIKEIYLADKYFRISGEGYQPNGEVFSQTAADRQKLKQILELAYLSIKADVIYEENTWKPLGDPTEAAVAVLGQKLGLARGELMKKYQLVDVKPFDSLKRYLMAVLKDGGGNLWTVYIGAPEFLARELKIDHHLKDQYEKLTTAGKRILGMAVYGPKRGELYAYALAAITEEIRPKVAASIAEARNAGFKIAMMTGDYQQTAVAIAKSAGIFQDGDLILNGNELENMSEEELRKCVAKVTVFARITPDHKLRIVDCLKKLGHTVAMTGDGVNDGPALEAANLGIGLGGGTQVAQDASDIVLIDNNFSTIVAAINEGRSIYLTLKKVILYLFSTSLGEVLVIFVTILLGLPLPLVAVQIIWLNFVTDGFLDVALAQDPPEKLTVLLRKQSGDQVDRKMISRMILMGGSMLAATLPIFYVFHQNYGLEVARSMALLVLSITQWFNALNVRSEKTSIFNLSIINNRFLIAAFFAVLSLELFGLQTTWGNSFLHTKPLSLPFWLMAIFASSLIIWTEEARKKFTDIS